MPRGGRVKITRRVPRVYEQVKNGVADGNNNNNKKNKTQ